MWLCVTAPGVNPPVTKSCMGRYAQEIESRRQTSPECVVDVLEVIRKSSLDVISQFIIFSATWYPALKIIFKPM